MLTSSLVFIILVSYAVADFAVRVPDLSRLSTLDLGFGAKR